MDNVIEIVLSCLKEAGDFNNNQTLVNATPDTSLFGPDGILDSMGLVSLIVDVEQAISLELDRNITLADERAMSRKTSPFRSVRTLAAYACELMEEADG